MRILKPDEALSLIQFAREYHNGGRQLPPEIARKKGEIEQAIRNAELFVIMFRTVDYGLNMKAVTLMHEKDTLYEKWWQASTSTVH